MKIIAEYLPLQQGLSFIIKRKLHFLNVAYKDHSFFVKISQEEMLHKKKDDVFHCLTYNHHQISVCHANY